MKYATVKSVKNTVYGQLSLNNLINGTVCNKEGKYSKISKPLQAKAFNEIKSYLMGKCRKDSQPYKTIRNATLEGLGTYGIFGRLVVTLNDSKEIEANYICGQSWPDEIKVLKKLFK